MPTISESPVHREIRACQFDAYLLDRMIGEPTYLRSLFIVGFLPDEARTRLNLLKMSELWRNRNVR